MLEGWDVFLLKGGIHSSIWNTNISVQYQVAENSEIEQQLRHIFFGHPVGTVGFMNLNNLGSFIW